MRLPTAPARHSRVHVVALWVLALALASPADAASPAVTPGAATAGAVSPAAPGPVVSRPSGTAAPLLVRNRLVGVRLPAG